MNTKPVQFKVVDYRTFKQKMLNWANQFNIFCFLDNNEHVNTETSFEALLAVGCNTSLTFTGNNDFYLLHQYHAQKPTWLFGHLGYNAASNAYAMQQNEITGFEKGFFFEPQILLKITTNVVEVLKTNIPVQQILQDIDAINLQHQLPKIAQHIQALSTKEKYIADVQKLQQHIQLGDCYEINFCQKFFAHNTTIQVVDTYIALCNLSPTPFAALYKVNENYCLCASPERFLKKRGNIIQSQPIKGTTKRDVNNPEIDEANKNYLLNTPKEKSENVMVVDLVRNDLSMVCKKASVIVTELCKVYSYAQVHQMISTVQGTIADDKNFAQVLQACYPMGSMTGAPKQRVMQLIEQYENFDRNLFSGSIGYITPEADVDFNVVIRSILYNEEAKQINFLAGSGITFYSQAEKEYEECITKISAILQVLNGYL